jgi:hypothetical protein
MHYYRSKKPSGKQMKFHHSIAQSRRDDQLALVYLVY